MSVHLCPGAAPREHAFSASVTTRKQGYRFKFKPLVTGVQRYLLYVFSMQVLLHRYLLNALNSQKTVLKQQTCWLCFMRSDSLTTINLIFRINGLPCKGSESQLCGYSEYCLENSGLCGSFHSVPHILDLRNKHR